MRVPQLKGKHKGSQKWLQEIINICPELLNTRIAEQLPSLSDNKICWLSPLEEDEFAEYRDASFLQRVGLSDLTEELTHFWPKSGPQWDGLGKTLDGEALILVEAKANVPELISTCGAKAETSLDMISKSLAETQRWLKCQNSLIDWKSGFYQYANRLAHLYFLRRKSSKQAFLVFLYFVDDSTHIPTPRQAWDAALELQKKLMGLPAENLTGKAIDLFIKTQEIRAV
jgi:hypothetical protein